MNAGEQGAPPGTEDALELVFAPLDQVGPGSDATTLAALAELQPIPSGGAIYDLGCGPGRDLVTFTWNIKTCEGRDQIADMLRTQLATVRPGNYMAGSFDCGNIENGSDGTEARTWWADRPCSNTRPYVCETR